MLLKAMSVAGALAVAACLVLAVACEDEGAEPEATGGAQTPGSAPSLEPTPTSEPIPTLTPAVSRTEIVIAEPPATPSREVKGSCWGPSSGVIRPNAWRCAEEDGTMHDPCFSQSGADTFVLCLTGEKIELTESLPLSQGHQKEDPSHALSLNLADGTTCTFVQGATAVVDGERVNYSCSDGGWVVGFPQTGQVWIVRKVWFPEPLEPPYEPSADASVAVTRAVR